MAEFPHFSDGRYGKLTPEVLNGLIDKVNSIDAIMQQPSTHMSRQRGASSQFPMPAQLTGLLGQGEETDDPEQQPLIGYSWQSLVWGGTRWNHGPYKYIPQEELEEGQKASPAIMIGGTSASMNSSLVNSFVLLHPFNSSDGGSFLGFQTPIQSNTFIGKIVTSNEGCSVPEDQQYQVAIQKVEDGAFVGTGEFTTAVNGTEIERGGNMGGQLSGSQCNVNLVPASIPNGMFVVCQRMTDDLSIFTLANDLCVTCNCESTSTDTARSEVDRSVEKYRQSNSDLIGDSSNQVDNFSGSIAGEMNK